MTNDDFHFKWNFYSDHCAELLQDINKTKDFTDITLVCEDLTQINAHKVVLSACSPVLRKLISSNPHPLPLIFMRGISREVLKSLVDFMYLGETSFSQHGMEDFLKCAKELEVKNLVNEDKSSQENSDKIINEIQKEVGNLFSCKYCDLKISRKSSLIKHLATTHSKFTEAKELINEIRGKERNEEMQPPPASENDPEPEFKNLVETKLEIEENELSVSSGSVEGSDGEETINSYRSRKTSEHKNSKSQKRIHWILGTHYTMTKDDQYKCSECGKKYVDKSSFSRHFHEAHLGRKYTCDICGMKATQRTGLDRHIKDVHTKGYDRRR